VQLAMPPGGEDVARAFYVGVLGLSERLKPPELAVRGGVWFGSGPVQIHLGIDQDFRPARKAHPAIKVEDIDALATRIRAAGHEVHFALDLPGYRRFYTSDGFGNRLEFLEPLERRG
jgi:catechol 2,3-dioxygenase-like lactoylglutathione lyase family enzyme